jgi:hypothetical protein
MSAEEILKMIEDASPGDADKLDAIDVCVASYLHGKEYAAHRLSGFTAILLTENGEVVAVGSQYTRSRDALKIIRPEGWRLEIQHVRSLSDAGKTKWYSSLISPCSNYEVNVGPMPTEELAELHAIIQAIEYERTK